MCLTMLQRPGARVRPDGRDSLRAAVRLQHTLRRFPSPDFPDRRSACLHTDRTNRLYFFLSCLAADKTSFRPAAWAATRCVPRATLGRSQTSFPRVTPSPCRPGALLPCRTRQVWWGVFTRHFLLSDSQTRVNRPSCYSKFIGVKLVSKFICPLKILFLFVPEKELQIRFLIVKY